jgi:FkbM family methyltransferase
MLKGVALRALNAGVRLPQYNIDRVFEAARLRELLRLLRVDCVIDVGANRGQYASDLRVLGYTGEIISFEPVASEYEKLCDCFRKDRRWRGHRLALGSENKTAQMNVIMNMTVMSSLLKPIVPQSHVNHETVEVRRLDDVLTTPANRCFLKIDAQGYDQEVFKGASGIMSKIVGMQTEVYVKPRYASASHYLDDLRLYEEAGFRLHAVTAVNRDEDGGIIGMNCFLRKL